MELIRKGSVKEIYRVDRKSLVSDLPISFLCLTAGRIPRRSPRKERPSAIVR